MYHSVLSHCLLTLLTLLTLLSTELILLYCAMQCRAVLYCALLCSVCLHPFHSIPPKLILLLSIIFIHSFMIYERMKK